MPRDNGQVPCWILWFSIRTRCNFNGDITDCYDFAVVALSIEQITWNFSDCLGKLFKFEIKLRNPNWILHHILIENPF